MAWFGYTTNWSGEDGQASSLNDYQPARTNLQPLKHDGGLHKKIGISLGLAIAPMGIWGYVW